MLTSQERERIRDEIILRDEIRRELSDARPRESVTRLKAFALGVTAVLNSPFILSCVVALAVSFITHQWQEDAKNREQERARIAAQRDKKHDAALRFFKEYYSFVLTYVDLHRSDVTLQVLEKKSGKQDQRIFDEMLQRNSILAKDYRARMPKAATAMADVELLFENPKIRQTTFEVLQIEAAIMQTDNQNDFKKLADLLDQKLRLLQHLMRAEIFEKPTS